MLRYLYVPKDDDIEDHINFAVENNFNQVIYGESEILKGLIQDENHAQEINMPEFIGLTDDFLSFEESKPFSIELINEYFVNEQNPSLYLYLYKIDDLDFNKKTFMYSKIMESINNIIYKIDLSIDEYGEYQFYIIDNDSIDSEEYLKENNIFNDKIIIYKVSVEEVKDDKFIF